VEQHELLLLQLHANASTTPRTEAAAPKVSNLQPTHTLRMTQVTTTCSAETDRRRPVGKPDAPDLNLTCIGIMQRATSKLHCPILSMKPPGGWCSAGPAQAQHHETLNPRGFEWPSAVLMLSLRVYCLAFIFYSKPFVTGKRYRSKQLLKPKCFCKHVKSPLRSAPIHVTRSLLHGTDQNFTGVK
jgi:hypothetical protein